MAAILRSTQRCILPRKFIVPRSSVWRAEVTFWPADTTDSLTQEEILADHGPERFAGLSRRGHRSWKLSSNPCNNTEKQQNHEVHEGNQCREEEQTIGTRSRSHLGIRVSSLSSLTFGPRSDLRTSFGRRLFCLLFSVFERFLPSCLCLLVNAWHVGVTLWACWCAAFCAGKHSPTRADVTAAVAGIETYRYRITMYHCSIEDIHGYSYSQPLRGSHPPAPNPSWKLGVQICRRISFSRSKNPQCWPHVQPMWLAITNSFLLIGIFQTLLGPIFPPIWPMLGPGWAILSHVDPLFHLCWTDVWPILSQV